MDSVDRLVRYYGKDINIAKGKIELFGPFLLNIENDASAFDVFRRHWPKDKSDNWVVLGDSTKHGQKNSPNMNFLRSKIGGDAFRHIYQTLIDIASRADEKSGNVLTYVLFNNSIINKKVAFLPINFF